MFDDWSMDPETGNNYSGQRILTTLLPRFRGMFTKNEMLEMNV
jgi:hypothetical protein